MEIVNAYEVVGTYRGGAALCGTTHKTVKRIMNRFESKIPWLRAWLAICRPTATGASRATGAG